VAQRGRGQQGGRSQHRQKGANQGQDRADRGREGRARGAESRGGERGAAGRGSAAGRGGAVDRGGAAGRGGAVDRGGASGRGPSYGAERGNGRGIGRVSERAPERGLAPRPDARRGGRTGAAASAVSEALAHGLQLKAAKRKGEWLELKLPESLAGVPLNGLMRLLPIPPKVAGRLISVGGVVRQGKQLRLALFPPERPEFEAEFAELNILYEDDFTLVVNKPPGVEVHPSVKGQGGTLAHAVAAYYDMTNQACRVRHIHRLDKDTTGPVLYAKNELAHYVFDQAMREKGIERVYVALAEGVIKDNKGVIDAPIGQDRHHSTRRRVSETGERAVTRYEVVERFADHTLVRLRLETGRTHQIRVHLSHIGHPIAGDGLYGGHRPLMHRQALHGEKLVWPHPWTGEPMSVRASLPDDFAAVLRKLRER